MTRTKMGRKKSSIAKRSMMHSSQSSATLSSTAADAGFPAELQRLMSTQYETRQELIDACNAYFDSNAAKLTEHYQKAEEELKSLVQRDLNGLPESVRKAKLTSLMNETTKPLRRSHSIEEVPFKKPETPPKVLPKRQSRQRSRSATPSSRSGFKTPTTFRRFVAGSTITPKVYNDAPITVMRRPMQGEMAVSVTGSPLMVSAVSSEEVPTVNVPLMDGRVFSIMPEVGDPLFDLPQFDEVTRQHLKTLREHLLKLAPDSP